ncbi:MAG: hypothetical protein ABI399_00250 [Bauldia sp.]
MPRWPTAFAILSFVLAASPASAASFDCGKAQKPDEFAICANPELSDLDVEMATLYGVRMEIPMMMGAKGAAQDEQVAFLQQRGACGGNVACIAAAYRERIATLKQTISGAMQDYCSKIGLC